MNRFTILIVDDEADLRDFLKYRFEQYGYQVLTAGSGKEAIDTLEKTIPDLVILDVMMTGMDGYEVCRQIRKTPRWKEVLVLMLTAKKQESEEIEGLDEGADDYVTKPVSTRLLQSRVQALLRRKARTPKQSALRGRNLVLDRSQYLVRVRTEEEGVSEVYFPRKEFELLAFLMERPGIVCSRQEILNVVWGTEVHVFDRTVDVHIRKIRKKIGNQAIKTIKGIGYRFNKED